jgi:hypothetical protein
MMATISSNFRQEVWPEMNGSEMARKVEGWMKSILAVNQALENTLVDVVAAFTPWIAPLVPAAIGYDNVRTYLHFDPWLAFVYALVVEFLGLATVTTALQFWSWNQTKSEERQGEAPFLLALSTALFYLAITISVNVLLDEGTTLVKVVKALASTFSIVGALTLALRSQQSKRQAAVDERKAEEASQAQLEAEKLASAERVRLESLRLEKETELEKFRILEREKAQEREEKRKFLHEEKLAEIAAKLAESQAKVSAQVSVSSGKLSESNEFPETFGKWTDWRQVPEEHRRRMAGMTIKQVAAEYGVIEKTAGNWIRNAKTEFGG